MDFFSYVYGFELITRKSNLEVQYSGIRNHVNDQSRG
jgi:hypothetical protein